MPRTTIVLLASTTALAGCTLDPSEKRSCADQSDCVSGYVCADSICVSWGCLDNPGVPAEEDIEIVLHLNDEATDDPIAGAEVRTCLRSDVGCADPQTTVITDAEGIARLHVSDHFLEVEAARYQRVLVMGTASLEPLEDQPSGPAIAAELNLFESSQLASIVASSGVQLEPNTGILDIGVVDCDFRAASGVTFSLQDGAPETVVSYLAEDLPSATASETDAGSSSAFAFNVPLGLRPVEARVVALDRLVASPMVVIVREGWLTNVTFAPTGVRLRKP